ncbi:MAG: molybdate ABC transporter substrate-binding protein [Rhodospirillales bacterium]|nr:molybdate ABC transporter substrate-binding protein [Rhodospirillales bacterium]
MTVFTFIVTPGSARSSEPPIVAAASDLQFALVDIADAFKAETGRDVVLTFGSSGNIARQIRQGAAFDIFLSADETLVLDLAKDGFTRDDGRLYGAGRLVLVVPHGSPLKADGSLADLKNALADGRLGKFAIANPDHAPYGKRAEEALRHAGVWDAVQPRIVLGENVAQAAQFATSSNAEGGLIAHSLVLSPKVSALGAFDLVPEDWHSPLRQRMVLLKDAGPAAALFYDYLQRSAARAIFRAYGFDTPDEDR